MRFSIIGRGFIFPVHSQAIKEVGGEIVDIVDEADGPDAWREMVKKTDADCIVILTPNDLHFEMAKYSAEQGRIVLCEKPLAIRSSDVRVLDGQKNIFTVSQLKYHPYIRKIESEQLTKNIKHNIEMNICFRRNDEGYINNWKNNVERSGGFLFNIGIHYFDLLLYLFGDAKEIKVEKIYEKNDTAPEAEGKGVIIGENYVCNWQMHINKKEQGEIVKKREFIINDAPYNFSSKDNLAQENLHQFVYRDLLNGKGIAPNEALKSIELVEKIYKNLPTVEP